MINIKCFSFSSMSTGRGIKQTENIFSNDMTILACQIQKCTLKIFVRSRTRQIYNIFSLKFDYFRFMVLLEN